MSTLTARIDLPPAPLSIVAARHVLRDVLGAWGSPHDGEDAQLLTTELVANVVDHVGGAAHFGLEITLSPAVLRVAVADGSRIRPVLREFSADGLRGRGLRLVAAIADRWGVEEDAEGKRVWFEFAAPAS